MVRVANVQVLLPKARCSTAGTGGILGCRSAATLLGSQSRAGIDDWLSSISCSHRFALGPKP